MDPPIEGIWVADSNLFQRTFGRRFLSGLAAYTDQPLMFVPAVVHYREVPNAITFGLSIHRERYTSQPFLQLLADEVWQWLDTQLNSNPLFEYRELPKNYDPRNQWFELHSVFTPDFENRKYPHDVDIVLETLAVGGDFIATNNLKTINHSKLNDWARVERGYNRSVIGKADDLVERLLDRPVDEAVLIMAAMSVGGNHRESNQELETVASFANRLKLGHWGQTGAFSEELLIDLDKEVWEDRLREVRSLASSPRFPTARRIERELQTIRAKVVQTALAKKWIADPSDEERTLIRKFLQDRGRE